MERADPLTILMLENIQGELIELDNKKEKLLALRSEILNGLLDGSEICKRVRLSSKVEVCSII